MIFKASEIGINNFSWILSALSDPMEAIFKDQINLVHGPLIIIHIDSI